jgi:hypothetical protein
MQLKNEYGEVNLTEKEIKCDIEYKPSFFGGKTSFERVYTIDLKSIDQVLIPSHTLEKISMTIFFLCGIVGTYFGLTLYENGGMINQITGEDISVQNGMFVIIIGLLFFGLGIMFYRSIYRKPNIESVRVVLNKSFIIGELNGENRIKEVYWGSMEECQKLKTGIKKNIKSL